VAAGQVNEHIFETALARVEVQEVRAVAVDGV
jgi:hypothetical protein